MFVTLTAIIKGDEADAKEAVSLQVSVESTREFPKERTEAVHRTSFNEAVVVTCFLLESGSLPVELVERSLVNAMNKWLVGNTCDPLPVLLHYSVQVQHTDGACRTTARESSRTVTA